MLNCKYCFKPRKNNNSLINHQRLCKENPDRQNTTFQDGNFQRSKQKKNQYSNSNYVTSADTKIKISIANKNRPKEIRKIQNKKISDTISKKVLEGNWHTSLAKHMHVNYKGIDLHGSWELKYAKYLDENNIEWERNHRSFVYEYENKLRRYTPDFYIISKKEYIEIKGYKTKKDEAKWNQFPKDKKLIVLMREELKTLGIL